MRDEWEVNGNIKTTCVKRPSSATKRKLNRHKKSWGRSHQSLYGQARLGDVAIGFSSGLPYLLIFSSLSIWLKEAGFDIKIITMFSWAMLGYSFKLFWSPLVNAVPIPLLTKMLGQRRSWLIVAQMVVAFAILCLVVLTPRVTLCLITWHFLPCCWFFSGDTRRCDWCLSHWKLLKIHCSLYSLVCLWRATESVWFICRGRALFLAEYFGSTKATYNYAAGNKPIILWHPWC